MRAGGARFHRQHGWQRRYELHFTHGHSNETVRRTFWLPNFNVDMVNERMEAYRAFSFYSGQKLRITCLGSGEYTEWTWTPGKGWGLTTNTVRP